MNKQNNNTSEKCNVLVLSRYWPTALSVVRSLGAAGFHVDLIASVSESGASEIAAASKYVGHFSETVCKSVKRRDDPGLLKALKAYQPYNHSPDKTVLFPTDDYTSSFIDRHKDDLRDHFVFPDAGNGSEGTITNLMNKQTQSRLATEAGLRCPPEWIISLEDEGLPIPDDVIYPCFVKPAESVSGFKGEMAKCQTKDALVAHLELLRSKNPHRNVLVQKYLKIDSELDIGGVAFSEGVFIPAVIKKTCIAQHERGVTAAGIIAQPETISEIYDAVCRLFKLCGYIGMFDMEINVADGELYFGELNFRSGGPNYAYYLSGVNLPELAVMAVRGEECSRSDQKSIEYGMSFASEKVLWKEYLKGCMTMGEVKRIIKDADAGLIASIDDPEPVRLFEERLHQDIEKKRKKKIKSIGRRLRRPLKPVKELILGYPQYRPWNSRKISALPRVMVVGRNFSSNLCMARSLGQAGYDVEIMRVYNRKPAKSDILTGMIPEAYSKYVKAFRSCAMRGVYSRAADALLEASSPKNKMLLIPTDDVSAYVIDESYDRLKKAYIMPNIRDDQGEIIRLMDKYAQIQLAKACGVPTLRSCVANCLNGRYEIPDDIRYPCFIKPIISSRSSKRWMRICGSYEELRTALDEILQTAEPDMLIEEYVEIRREISLLGLCADGKVICPGLIQATSGGEGARRGVAAAGVSLPVAGSNLISADIMNKLHTFMILTGYCGLFDIDLIETTDGSLYFLEVNLRYGASGYVVTCDGINLPGMFADYMLKGIPIPEESELLTHDLNNKPDENGGEQPITAFVSEKVLLENYSEGAATEEEIMTAFDSDCLHFIKNEDDPGPYAVFSKAANKLIKQKKAERS